MPKYFLARAIGRIAPGLKHTITKTCLFKYTEHFTTKKWKFSDKKNSDIFHISAQNIDCGYSLEPPHYLCFWTEIRKITYTSVNPIFTKSGFKGVKII